MKVKLSEMKESTDLASHILKKSRENRTGGGTELMELWRF